MAQRDEPTTDLGHIDSPAVKPTNDMALVSMLTGLGGWGVLLLGLCSAGSPFGLVCGGIAVISWSAALVTGYVAQNEIHERGETGRGMARLGMGAGVAGVLLAMLGLVLLVLGLLGLISLGIIDSLIG